MSPLGARQAEEDEWPAIAAAAGGFESDVSYPLGPDRFRISHGPDYFRFFRRLGDPRVFVATSAAARIEAVLVAVLRRAPAGSGLPERFLYVCDLKARPGRRGPASLPALADAFRRFRAREALPVYGVSMNDSGGGSRMTRVLPRLGIGIERTTRLGIFSLDAGQALAAVRHLPDGKSTRWVSLAGIKDIVLLSTGRPMRLLHAQAGPFAAGGGIGPVAGSVHMLAAPERSVISTILEAEGIRAGASATVLSEGFPSGEDFAFVLTNEI